MRKKVFIICTISFALFIIPLGFSFCTNAKTNNMNNINRFDLCTDLLKIEYANPYNDLKNAIMKNDFRFIALKLNSVIIPGTDDAYPGFHSEYQKYLHLGYVIFEGITENTKNYKHGRLVTIAKLYAKIYNHSLLTKLKGFEVYDFDKDYSSFHPDLLRIEKANPYEDFEKTRIDKKLNFLAMRGYALYFPGIEGFQKSGKYGYKTIGGSSDSIRNYEHGRLNAIAEYYATIYNQLVLEELEREKQKK